jgi:hypothetical protein
MAEFDIERFVTLSKAVDLSDIDWAEARRVGITDDEYTVIRFMADIEIHTIIYLRDVLAGHTASNPEVTQFMACWVYEETFHGRALDRFLTEIGRPEPNRFHEIESNYSWREEFTGMLSRGFAFLTPHISAVHMCWGAINELTAAASYLALARRTRNAPLAKLVTKLARDERKHYAFYFSQAEKRLEAWGARRLCEFSIARFWEPVGVGIGDGAANLALATSMLFGDEQGRQEFAAVDQAIQRLPGMGWFKMLSNYRERALVEFARSNPADFARHREADREFAAKKVAA